MTLAQELRSKMKAKAGRLAHQKDGKVDSSDWSPGEPLNADVKTGMRPISRTAFKSGGLVCGNEDLKSDNEKRDGKKHVGALKRGGRTRQEGGKVVSSPDGSKTFVREGITSDDISKIAEGRIHKRFDEKSNTSPALQKDEIMLAKSAGDLRATEPSRSRRASGGGVDVPKNRFNFGQGAQGSPYAKGGEVKKKGATHINIVINSGKEQAENPSQPLGMTRPPMPPAMPPTPMAGPSGPPAMPPAQMAGSPAGGGIEALLGGLPQGRKRGGRVRSYKDLDAGAGSGVGRLEKTEIAKSSD